MYYLVNNIYSRQCGGDFQVRKRQTDSFCSVIVKGSKMKFCLLVVAGMMAAGTARAAGTDDMGALKNILVCCRN